MPEIPKVRRVRVVFGPFPIRSIDQATFGNIIPQMVKALEAPTPTRTTIGNLLPSIRATVDTFTHDMKEIQSELEQTQQFIGPQ
jgi:hypothetical protein